MIVVSPSNPTVAHGGSTLQLTVPRETFAEFDIVQPPTVLGCTMTPGGLLTTGTPTGTLNVLCKRYDGEYVIVPVTIT